MTPAHVEVINRPHSRYQRSLHAQKDWWDKCNVNVNVKVVETWTVYFAKVKLPYRFERINKLDRDCSYWDILSLVCPLKYRLKFLLSQHYILERVQRWWVLWIRSITSCYCRSFNIYFLYSSCLSFIFHSSIHPSPQLYIHRSFVPSFVHSFHSWIWINDQSSSVSLCQVFKPRCSFHESPHKVKGNDIFFKSCSLYLRPILWQTMIFAWELTRHVIRG